MECPAPTAPPAEDDSPERELPLALEVAPVDCAAPYYAPPEAHPVAAELLPAAPASRRLPAAPAPPPGQLRLRCTWVVPPLPAGCGGDDTGYVAALLELPDGRVAAGYRDGCIRVWPPVLLDSSSSRRCGAGAGAAGPLLTLAGHTDAVLALAWLPEARLLASGGSDGCLRLWALPPLLPPGGAAAAAACVASVRAHDSGVRCCVAAGGERLVTGGWDGALRQWGVAVPGGARDGCVALVGAPVELPDGHPGGVSALGLLHHHAFASAGDDGAVRVWELAPPSPSSAAAASPAAAQCAAHLRPLPHHGGSRPHCGGVLSLFAQSDDGEEAHGGAPAQLLPSMGSRCRLAVTAVHNDGCVHSWLGEGSGACGGAAAWALAGSVRLGPPEQPPVACCAPLPDGRLALGCGRGLVLLLLPPALGGGCVELRGGHAASTVVRALVVAAGGRALVSADDEGAIAVWDV